jgi:hypothetical protein
MKRIIFALITLASFETHATMYLAAYDPVTKETGLIYSSSGGHFWQTKVKGKGLAGAQNYGLCDEATPEEFLEQGLSASEVAKRVHDQCAAVKYYNYRFLVITSDGQIDYVIGENGCAIPDCGARRGNNVVVTGGGLEKGVLDAAIKAYESQPLNISFTCRLYNTLKQIYYSGGQTKDFMGASITVDHPGKAGLLDVATDVFNGGTQQNLLKTLNQDLKNLGENCSP